MGISHDAHHNLHAIVTLLSADATLVLDFSRGQSASGRDICELKHGLKRCGADLQFYLKHPQVSRTPQRI